MLTVKKMEHGEVEKLKFVSQTFDRDSFLDYWSLIL